MTDLTLLIACPECKSDLLLNKDSYECSSCKNKEKSNFKIIHNVPVLMTGIETDYNQKFWDEGWQNRNEKSDFKFVNLPDKQYKKIIDDQIKQTLEFEKPLSFLNAKKTDIILNVGCGLSEASGFSAMKFENYIGLDFSFKAALGSLKNIRKYNENGITMQANAEKLPIKNNTIDVVYSSGVLHHTPNINQTLIEIKRVLKPNGQAVIGLYNSNSPKFLMAKLKNKINNLFKKETMQWYENTETSWQANNNLNPWSETFSYKQIQDLFKISGLTNITINKTNFQWGDSLPIIGKYINKIKFIPKSSHFLRKNFGSMWVIIAKK